VVVAPQIYGPRPNASAQESYVKGVYRTLLGRDADPSGLTYWVGHLNGGTARSSLVTAFWNSPENRGREVDAYYQAYLGRSADPTGRSFWVGQLQGGADETTIVLSFLLSAEALSAPNNVFIQRLYQGALGRGASTSEVNSWVGQLTQGTTRQQVANSFVFSSEAAGVAVDSFYEAYFQRLSDPTGRAYWVGQISDRKATYASLAISLLESDEFFKNAAT
jgi:thermitase